MSDPKHPVVGAMIIDATDVTPVFDLTPDQIRSKTKVRPGFAGAIAALTRLSPEQSQLGGINTDEVQRAVDLKAQYDRCEELLPAAEKLVELLRETRIEHGHQIGIILSEMAHLVRRRAERDPKAGEILGALTDLTDYVSGPAVKAVESRAKREEDESSRGPVKENGASAPLVS